MLISHFKFQFRCHLELVTLHHPDPGLQGLDKFQGKNKYILTQNIDFLFNNINKTKIR